GVVAMFLAVGLNPAVEFLMRRGLKRPWAVLCVITGVILVFAGFLTILVPIISDQVSAVGVGLAILGALLNAFVVVVLTLYFLASLPSLKQAAYSLAPATRRERVSLLGDRILRNIGGYVSGAFVVATCA